MLEISRPTDIVTLAADITTNTTTQAVRGRAGYKTFWAEVVGTGAVERCSESEAHALAALAEAMRQGHDATHQVRIGLHLGDDLADT